MENELIIPDLNPVKFVELNPAELPQYLSRHLENYRFGEQQMPWEQHVNYFQKWQTSDITRFQFTSNFSPIQIDVLDKYGIARASLSAVPVRENKFVPGYYCYEITLSWAGIQPGCYVLQLTGGSPAGVTMVSEPQLISVKHPNTLLLEYRNSRFHGDVIFETGIKFGLRLEGRIGKVNPGRNSTVFEDEPLNPTVLKSTAFRSFPLLMGGSRGLPDWAVDKFNLMWTCDSVQGDGKFFAATGDSKQEYNEAERYPMRGIIMEVREGKNRGSKIVGGTFNSDDELLVVYNIDSKSFGDISQQGSSNVILITDVE